MTEKLQALNGDNCLNFWRENQPRCPHCGAEYSIDDNEAWHLYGEDGSEHGITCPSCDIDFTVTVTIKHEFSTDEQPDEDEEDD